MIIYRTDRSSNIKNFYFDRMLQQLHVEFKSGAGYIYFGVPEVLVKEWTRAPSYGKFFWRYIRDQYPYIRAY